MIRWLVQTVVDHPDISAGRPPAGLLTPIESGQYRSIINPQRRRDWLLGRWTAKRLIQMNTASTDGFHPALNSFALEQESSGAPYVASHHPALCGKHTGGRLPLALSISHSNGYAFCVLCDNYAGKARLGADIELVAPRAESFAGDFFTCEEQAIVNAAPEALHSLLMTTIWSAKEAVLKATQVGLRADPRAVQCLVRPTPHRSWTPLRVELLPALQTQVGELGPLCVWWRVLDNRLRPGTLFIQTIAANGTRL